MHASESASEARIAPWRLGDAASAYSTRFATGTSGSLFAGQTVSLIGDAAFLTALGWRTFTLVGAGGFGIVLFCQATALLTTLLIGGALADRISRRKMMIASDLARFVAVGALAAIDASGHLTFTLIIVLAT